MYGVFFLAHSRHTTYILMDLVDGMEEDCVNVIKYIIFLIRDLSMTQSEGFILQPLSPPPAWLGPIQSYTVSTGGVSVSHMSQACSLPVRYLQIVHSLYQSL